MASKSHKAFMAKALSLSKQALPHCRPNPPVGCVLVKNNKIIGQGFTQAPGQHHAEAQALDTANTSDIEGASAYVTLEPCSFYGRTPSCATALIEAGITTVYIALLDPDPRNSGRGVEVLQHAGLAVHLGILDTQVHEFLSPYLHQMSKNGV